jgi:hypothetical protein
MTLTEIFDKYKERNRNSSVVMTGCVLDSRAIWVQFTSPARDFSVRSVQIDSETHPNGSGSTFLSAKAVGAFSLKLYRYSSVKFSWTTQNYWDFGLCPSSGILETREHNVSETESVSFLRWGGDTYSVRSLIGELYFSILLHCLCQKYICTVSVLKCNLVFRCFFSLSLSR